LSPHYGVWSGKSTKRKINNCSVPPLIMQTAGFCIFIEVYSSRRRMFLLTDLLLLKLSFLSTHVANQVPVVIFSSSSFLRSFLRTLHFRSCLHLRIFCFSFVILRVSFIYSTAPSSHPVAYISRRRSSVFITI